jgi:hypothetical protein
MKRKGALKRLQGLAPIVEAHLDKIRDNPSSRDVPHWTHEIVEWMRQMEALFPDVGQRTAEDWMRRIEDWKRRLGV